MNSSSGSGSAGSSGTYSVSSSRALSSKSVFAPAVSSAVTRWRRVIGRDVASDGSLRFEPGAAGARAVEAAVLCFACIFGASAHLREPRLRLRRLPFLGRAVEEGGAVMPEGRLTAALRGSGVGSAADFSASGTDGGGGSGPHGRDGGRIALPSESWAP